MKRRTLIPRFARSERKRTTSNVHVTDSHLSGVVDRAIALGQEDHGRFVFDETWANVPTPAQLILKETGEQMLNNIGEEWRAANRELEANAVRLLARYRRDHERLIRREAEQELQRIRFEELVNDDSHSYDRHRRYERKYNRSSIAHWTLLVLFAIGEFPLNVKALEQLGDGIGTLPKDMLALAIGVVLIGLAHIAGVFLKRLVTEHRELYIPGEKFQSRSELGVLIAKSLVVVFALIVGVYGIIQLGAVRESELEAEQVRIVRANRTEVNFIDARSLQASDPQATADLESKRAIAVTKLVGAQQRLCSEIQGTQEAQQTFGPCASAPAPPDAATQNLPGTTALISKVRPFKEIATALWIIQLGMFIVAFAIAFKSHDETLHQVKNQFEQYAKSKRRVRKARKRTEKSEADLGAAVVERSNTFGQYLDHAHETSAGFISAQWAYLRALQGDRATPESSSTLPVPISEAPWMFDEYRPNPFRTGARDPDYRGLSLRNPHIYRAQYPEDPTNFAPVNSKVHDAIARAEEIRAGHPHLADTSFGVSMNDDVGETLSYDDLVFVPVNTVDDELVTIASTSTTRWPATTRMLTRVARRPRPRAAEEFSTAGAATDDDHDRYEDSDGTQSTYFEQPTP